MENYADDIYEVLDELNSRIEEIVNEHPNPEELERIIPILQEKVLDFIEDFHQEIEKLELIEI
ncbi:hypothetical protein ACFL55_02315 [Candidatus Latescibacterota bacterium]